MRRSFLLMAAASVAAALAPAQAPNRITLIVERSEAGGWRSVDPSLIFSANDRIRFRYSGNFSGYLYVMNHSTSGRYEMLFPRLDTGEQNRIEAGREYVVPATQGWFRVTGPPGHDVLYWVISPMDLAGAPTAYKPLPPPPPPGEAPASLKPRCDDTIFKARGDCVDSSAGPKQVRPNEALPENLRGLPGGGSRELMFIQNHHQTIISSPTPLDGPAIYEFRLSHR